MERSVMKDWLHRYADAWEKRDPDAAAALFTENGEYHVTPFRALRGHTEIREYWGDATAGQEDIEVSTEVICVTDELAVGRFVAERIESGKFAITDGICLMKFEGDRCREFREWWHTSRAQ